MYAIRSYYEWTYISKDKSYKAIFSLLGDNIIVRKVWGSTCLEDSKEAMKILENIADNYIEKNNKYIYIEDYSEHVRTTPEAKQFYINYMRTNKRLKELLFFGVNPFLGIVIKLAKRLT